MYHPTSAYSSQRTQELVITGIRWGSHAQSIFLTPEPTGSSQPPWQELIGRAAPHLPTSTHGNAQLPHLAKGKAPLELVVSFKGKGKLPGKWSQGGKAKGDGKQQALPCPSVWHKRRPPTIRFHPASTSPAPHHWALPGPLTLVTVGEVSSIHAVNQTLSGSRTVLCRIKLVSTDLREGDARPIPKELQGGWPPICTL